MRNTPYGSPGSCCARFERPEGLRQAADLALPGYMQLILRPFFLVWFFVICDFFSHVFLLSTKRQGVDPAVKPERQKGIRDPNRR